MITTESRWQDENGNEIQFTRKENGLDGEVIIIEHNSSGDFISHQHYFYLSDKLQEWTCLSESGEVISRKVMEYGPDVWDGWCREFEGAGQLLRQIFFTWDKTHQAKAALYYNAMDEYLGKKVDSLKEGNYYPLYFDKEGNLISYNPLDGTT
jgi:hypothetical protein